MIQIPVCVLLEMPFETTLEIVPPTSKDHRVYSIRTIAPSDEFDGEDGQRIPANDGEITITKIKVPGEPLDRPIRIGPLEREVSAQFSKSNPLLLTILASKVPCTASFVIQAEEIDA